MLKLELAHTTAQSEVVSMAEQLVWARADAELARERLEKRRDSALEDRTKKLETDLATLEEEGAKARAATYIDLRVGDQGPLFGVGIDPNIVTASLKAVLSGLNRAMAQQVKAA